MSDSTLIMGAVAYAPKVVTIWEGFKAFFAQHGLAFDYLLYSNYERQVQAQFDGSLHLAWNSPLAWVRADRIARARGQSVRAIAMRDTDRDLHSVIVVRADSAAQNVAGLRGKVIGVGAIDSPQATLIPLGHLRAQGLLPGRDFTPRRFDALGGKHGDHIGGERDAAAALIAGEIDACCLIDGNHLAFGLDGTLPAGSTRLVARTAPYDHCNFTTSPGAPAALIERFTTLLMAMRWDDPQVRPLLELEGLREWRAGRTSGYALLERAVDDEGFYSHDGRILEDDNEVAVRPPQHTMAFESLPQRVAERVEDVFADRRAVFRRVFRLVVEAEHDQHIAPPVIGQAVDQFVHLVPVQRVAQGIAADIAPPVPRAIDPGLKLGDIVAQLGKLAFRLRQARLQCLQLPGSTAKESLQDGAGQLAIFQQPFHQGLHVEDFR